MSFDNYENMGIFSMNNNNNEKPVAEKFRKNRTRVTYMRHAPRWDDFYKFFVSFSVFLPRRRPAKYLACNDVDKRRIRHDNETRAVHETREPTARVSS